MTVENEIHQLPDPFLVIATQNQVAQADPFDLPEAQFHRFLAKTEIGFPDADGDVE